jgi:hypothetical protein
MSTLAKPTSFDYGNPPDAVREQEQHIASLVTAPAPVSVADAAVVQPGARIESPTEETIAGETIISPAVPISSSNGPTFKNQERVELEYVPDSPNTPAFRLSFTVGEVCVREHYVSMLIITDLGFKPTTTMKFNLKHKGKTIPVIFAGAEFEFQTIGVRGISFLIDKKRLDEARGRSAEIPGRGQPLDAD